MKRKIRILNPLCHSGQANCIMVAARIIYLHGFLSSPLSGKAQSLHSKMTELGLDEVLEIPALPFDPRDAMAQLQERLETLRANSQITLIGSSLGGYYAARLTQACGVQSVLINPLVKSRGLFDRYLGTVKSFHSNETFELLPEHLDYLDSLEITEISNPKAYRVYLQTGDESLDYRLAVEKFRGCPVSVEQGGSHSYDDFEKLIPEILTFAGIH